MVYTIDQLSGESREVALRNVEAVIEGMFYDSELGDFVDSLVGFVNRYHLELGSYRINLHDRSYVNVSLGSSFYDVVDDLYDLMESEYMDEAEGACGLTGVHTDALFYDYFRDIKFNVFVEDFGSELIKSVELAVKNFVASYEEMLREGNLVSFARDEYMEFNADGKKVS